MFRKSLKRRFINHSLVGDQENILLLSCSLPPEALKWWKHTMTYSRKIIWNRLLLSDRHKKPQSNTTNPPWNPNNPHTLFSTWKQTGEHPDSHHKTLSCFSEESVWDVILFHWSANPLHFSCKIQVFENSSWQYNVLKCKHFFIFMLGISLIVHTMFYKFV